MFRLTRFLTDAFAGCGGLCFGCYGGCSICTTARRKDTQFPRRGHLLPRHNVNISKHPDGPDTDQDKEWNTGFGA